MPVSLQAVHKCAGSERGGREERTFDMWVWSAGQGHGGLGWSGGSGMSCAARSMEPGEMR